LKPSHKSGDSLIPLSDFSVESPRPAGLGALRLHCPTATCDSTPTNWMDPRLQFEIGRSCLGRDFHQSRRSCLHVLSPAERVRGRSDRATRHRASHLWNDCAGSTRIGQHGANLPAPVPVLRIQNGLAIARRATSPRPRRRGSPATNCAAQIY